ncbi:MAG: site-specific DNA-methyltransferase, partial [Bryobacteraceae bacterium]
MRKEKRGVAAPVADYRHPEATRKNNPPAKIAGEGHVPLIPKAEYSYSPRLPPVLRFDAGGVTDELPELLAAARERPLTEAEAWTLADALRAHEPWLEWAGKREAKSFAVDPVALHIHERVSAQAILRVAARQDVERSLFADPEQEYNEAVQFYKHDVDWSNRMILGDSLQVMSSLARREDLAGKVQMIYIDPPYGIKFASNFQPEIGKRDVKDKETDLTREPEMVKAYRDTWRLGIHSYLSYLRDRLIVAKELLADTGSVFVQIGDENLHRITMLMDQALGAANRVAVISFVTTSSQTSDLLASTQAFLVWYARDREKIKYRPMYSDKELGAEGATKYTSAESSDGQRGSISLLGDGVFRAWRPSPMVSQSGGENASFPVVFDGETKVPRSGFWKTNRVGIQRLIDSNRIVSEGRSIAYVRYLDDFPVFPLSTFWSDTWGVQSRADPKRYVVQTATQIVERCLLMTTDPGDLVLDPTCGSGTTAYVAEQWGRRWITADTSRVAIAIARQRLLTAKYEYFKLKDESNGVAGGFRYKTVPHITLKSIAQNIHLDPIFAKHEPILNAKLAEANAALAEIADKLRQDLRMKLALKQKREGKKAITDADRRRWELPAKGKGWEHGEVPFDTDPDWPAALKKAVEVYRTAWRSKMDEVNACIAGNAEPEELVDQPEADRKVTRVSGPFTVEAVQPPEMSLDDPVLVDTAGFAGAPDELGETFLVSEVRIGDSPQNIEAYLSKMVELLRMDGVRFPGNKHKKFSRLDAIYASGRSSVIHAEGRWVNAGETDKEPNGPAAVGVVFGPQYGPITAKMVEETIRPAARRYEDLVFAGFSFDGPAQAAIEE